MNIHPADLIDRHWKPLTAVTLVILVISIGVLAHNVITKGSFMDRDVDLSGGKEITVEVADADIAKIKAAIPEANVLLTSGLRKSLILELPIEADENQVLSTLRTLVDFKGQPTLRTIGPSVASSFFQNAEIAIIAAFLLMALTVFILFRSPAPSSVVILAAATDIISTMAVLSLIGMPLSLPVLVALLTLIGYSVDTDLVLTNELIKSGRTDFRQGVHTAMKTGLTLTATALVALLAMLVFSGSIIIEQIATVLLIGLVIDIPATWLTNAGLLRFWLERKKK